MDNIKFVDVSIWTPDNRLLLKDFSITLRPGQNVMVSGPNGAGKTSLFRILAGLWPLQQGSLIRPKFSPHDIFYVPQNPYLVSGTLLDQILYPLSESDVDDQVHLHITSFVDL